MNLGKKVVLELLISTPLAGISALYESMRIRQLHDSYFDMKPN